MFENKPFVVATVVESEPIVEPLVTTNMRVNKIILLDTSRIS